MDLSTTIGFALGWSNASTRDAINKQTERLIQAQSEEYRKPRGPAEYHAAVWQPPKPSTFAQADASTTDAEGSDRGALTALFFLVALFFPPLAIVGLIFVYLREFLWLVAICCVAVVFVEPLGPVQIAVAFLVAGTCLACLLGEKISRVRLPAKRRRRKLPKHSLAHGLAFILASMLIPAFVFAAVFLSVH